MTKNKKKDWTMVRLSKEDSLKLRYLSLTSGRSMVNILEQYLDEIFYIAMKYRKNAIWFDASGDQIIVTVAGKFPRMTVGSEPIDEIMREKIGQVFAPKKSDNKVKLCKKQLKKR